MAGDGDKILLGRIGAAHGIKGEVRIASFTADPLAIAGYGPLATSRPGLTVEIAAIRLGNNVVVARLKGVADRTAAERLNGVELFIARDRLPATEDDDDFYHADLIGLEARLTSGVVLGTVNAVPNFGADDLLEVRAPDGETFLFPFTRKVVPEVQPAKGYVVIEPPLDADPGEEEPD